MRASDWKAVERNTLRGFCSLHLPSGLVLRDCSVHRHPEGREWVGLPGKPQMDRDGQPRRDPSTGKLLYSAIIEIPDRDTREKFQAAALAAVRLLIGESAP